MNDKCYNDTGAESVVSLYPLPHNAIVFVTVTHFFVPIMGDTFLKSLAAIKILFSF